MITFKNRLGTVDISADLREDYRRIISKFIYTTDIDLLDEKIILMTENDLKTVIQLMRRNNYSRPRDIRMLFAHGNSFDGKLMFVEILNKQKIWTPVDQWLDEHDGKYDALYVTPCDPDSVKIKPRKSFVVYPLSLNNFKSNFLSGHSYDSTSLTVVPPADYKPLDSK